MIKHKTFCLLAGMLLTFFLFCLFVLFEKLLPAAYRTANAASDTTASAIVETEESLPIFTPQTAPETAPETDVQETLPAEPARPSASLSAKPEEEPVLLTVYDGEQTKSVPLEEFVLSALIAEMPASFHEEALKAQAVAIRTFALKKSEAFQAGKAPAAHPDAALCTSSAHCCAYFSPADYEAKYGALATRSLPTFTNAVSVTAGQVVTYDGALIEAAFHSRSYLRTESAEAAWGGAVPYLQSVTTPEEDKVTVFTFSTAEAQQLFSSAMTVKEVSTAEKALPSPITTYNNAARVEKVTFGALSFTGKELRSLLKLPSSMFEIYTLEDSLIVTAHGSGHGVGLSQYGADRMAQLGSDYREILLHYYTDCQVEPLSALQKDR